MKIKKTRQAAIAVLLVTGACTTGQKSLYQWGDYQPALLSYAKNPQETQKFADRVKAVIDKGEVTNAVPPGLYAEYGYSLIDLNRTSEALDYFAKERDRWPESKTLMTRVIGRLSRSSTEPSATPADPAQGDGKPPVIRTPVPIVPTNAPIEK